MRNNYKYINPKFKQIFPEWVDFKNFLNDYIVYFDNSELTDDRILIYYSLLRRQFANSNIAYDMDIFLDKLSLLIEENFREFFKVRQLLELVHSSELKELLLGVESITNVAENPNVKTDKDSIVDYIGTQSRTRSKENIVDRMYTLVDRLRINEVMIEVYKYSDLFIQIIPRTSYWYEEDWEEIDVKYVPKKELETIYVTVKFGDYEEFVIIKGTVIEPYELEERLGYEFIGWYDDVGPFDFTKPVTKDLMLYDVWEFVFDPYLYESNFEPEDFNQIFNPLIVVTANGDLQFFSGANNVKVLGMNVDSSITFTVPTGYAIEWFKVKLPSEGVGEVAELYWSSGDVAQISLDNDLEIYPQVFDRAIHEIYHDPKTFSLLGQGPENYSYEMISKITIKLKEVTI